MLQSDVGATLSHDFKFDNGNIRQTADILTPEVHAGWLHYILNPRDNVSESFDGVTGSNFTSGGAAPDRNAGVIGVGFSYTPGEESNMSLFGRYEATVSSNETDQQVTAGLRYSW
jgi:outer membrane autotransporter protein